MVCVCVWRDCRAYCAPARGGRACSMEAYRHTCRASAHVPAGRAHRIPTSLKGASRCGRPTGAQLPPSQARQEDTRDEHTPVRGNDLTLGGEVHRFTARRVQMLEEGNEKNKSQASKVFPAFSLCLIPRIGKHDRLFLLPCRSAGRGRASAPQGGAGQEEQAAS